ncbi:hypothetical protein P7K49_012370 [Saguinus oedipus]|uniref:Uncharacterized protein n=1 Tax=Saguinus oedipus TaxID=9490 RepID=A0ABQ9VTB7_SAGOE|nr:hypothetical protein P7K49_012370 [Saguinus oedipus]
MGANPLILCPVGPGPLLSVIAPHPKSMLSPVNRISSGPCTTGRPSSRSQISTCGIVFLPALEAGGPGLPREGGMLGNQPFPSTDRAMGVKTVAELYERDREWEMQAEMAQI